jgi:hypothetical protein
VATNIGVEKSHMMLDGNWRTHTNDGEGVAMEVRMLTLKSEILRLKRAIQELIFVVEQSSLQMVKKLSLR